LSTNNSVDVSLAGQTGTVAFVGSTSPTITTPKIAQINDTNGNVSLANNAATSAVNYISNINSATGNAVSLIATGSDTNIGITLGSKGTGSVNLYSGGGAVANLILSSAASAVNYFNMTNAATGNSPLIAVGGSDTNIILTLNGQGTGGVAVHGTSTNDSASAGYVGEFATNSASSTSISNNTATNIVTLSLTAGDWDVWGAITYIAAGGTLPTTFISGVSSSSASVQGIYTQLSGIPWTSGATNQIDAPFNRISLAATSNVYLVGFASFTVSTMTTTGIIYARRVR